MADITMCMGKKCKCRDNCFRFTAQPSDYQSYFDPSLDKEQDEETCDSFWPNKSRYIRKVGYYEKQINNKRFPGK